MRRLENIDSKKELEQELQAARELQMSLLPQEIPQIQGFEIAAKSIPAREVGGDFYDFIVVDDSLLGILIGDISGKGITGAMMMAASRNTFRALATGMRSPGTALTRVNQRLNRDMKKGMYAAVSYSVVDESKGTIVLSNAGLEPFRVSRDGSRCEGLSQEGIRYPLGVSPASEYGQLQTLLNEGDMLLFCTDGIVEAMNPDDEIYGYERFENFLKTLTGESAQEVLKAIFDELKRWTKGAPQSDDITAIVLKSVRATSEKKTQIRIPKEQYATIGTLARAEQSFEITRKIMTIGRDEVNDIVLYSEHVSREHAVIELSEGRFTLRDLNSVNGTYLNNTRIFSEVTIDQGDEISFGGVKFEFSVQRYRPSSGSAEEHFLRGLALHKANELARARLEYHQALKQDDTYANAYFNLGIISHVQGDIDDAIGYFKNGLKLNPDDALAHANLGKLYEDQGLWEKALEEGRKAAELDRRLEQDVKRRRERIKRKASSAIKAQQSLKTASLEPLEIKQVRVFQNDLFRIEASAGVEEQDIYTVLGVLREAYNEMGEKYEHRPEKIQVAVCSDIEDFAEESRWQDVELPERAIAYFDGTAIRIRIPEKRGDYGSLRVNLRHEQMHLLIKDLTDGRCPSWLDEGLAEYEARKLLSSERKTLEEAKQQGKLLPLNQLFSDFLSEEQIRISYLQAYAAVEHIMRQFGREKVRELLRELKSGKSIEEVIQDVLGTTLKQLDNYRNKVSWRNQNV